MTAKDIIANLDKILETQCSRCEYDEAEGGLLDHCDTCCRKITTDLCELWWSLVTTVK